MSTLSSNRRESLVALTLALPYVVLLSILLLVPFVAILMKSLSSGDSFGLPLLSTGGSDGVFTLANYMFVLFDPASQKIFLTTVFISVAVATLLSAIGVCVGYYMMKRPGISGLISAIVTYPSLAPAITIILAILWMISPAGPVNYLLFRALGVIDFPIQFTGTMTAVIIGDIALFSTLAVRMAASLFEMVDPALEDASISLGANERETFFNVSLPLVLPGLTAIWVMVFIRTMVAYVAALLLGGGSMGVVVLPLEIFNRIQSLGVSGTMAQVCAYSVVLAMATLAGRLIYVFLIRRVFKGKLTGAVI